MGKNTIEITTRAEPNYQLVTVCGNLDTSNESVFSRELGDLCRAEAPHIVLDCSDLSYVNSACFGLFFHYHRQCESRRGCFLICGLSSKIESILKLLGLHQVLGVFSSVEEALNHLPAASTPG